MTKKITIDPKFKSICKKLIEQVDMVEFTDQMGQRLDNNNAYAHFKGIILKDGK